MTSFIKLAALLLFLCAVTPVLAADDPAASVQVFNRPQDFATAQQLALQNRAERMQMLQESVACVQTAATIDDLRTCQQAEGKSLAKIRLAYCATDLSWPVMKRPATVGADGTPSAPTECELATAAIRGKPLRPAGVSDATSAAQ